MRRPGCFCDIARPGDAEAVFEEPRGVAGEACLRLFFIAESSEMAILIESRII